VSENVRCISKETNAPALDLLATEIYVTFTSNPIMVRFAQKKSSREQRHSSPYLVVDAFAKFPGVKIIQLNQCCQFDLFSRVNAWTKYERFI
jgi:hypothetical protein